MDYLWTKTYKSNWDKELPENDVILVSYNNHWAVWCGTKGSRRFGIINRTKLYSGSNFIQAYFAFKDKCDELGLEIDPGSYGLRDTAQR